MERFADLTVAKFGGNLTCQSSTASDSDRSGLQCAPRVPQGAAEADGRRS
jgi:hypothetical protein